MNNNPYAPWCWNIYQHLPQKSPSFVGKYTIHGYTWSIWDNLSNQIPAPFKAIYFSSVEAAAIIPDPVISATQQSHSAALLPLRVPGRDTGNVGNGRKFRGSEAHGDQDFPTSVLRHWHCEPITARMKPILIVYQHHSTPKKSRKVSNQDGIICYISQMLGAGIQKPTKLGHFGGKCWFLYSSTMEHMGLGGCRSYWFQRIVRETHSYFW